MLKKALLGLILGFIGGTIVAVISFLIERHNRKKRKEELRKYQEQKRKRKEELRKYQEQNRNSK